MVTRSLLIVGLVTLAIALAITGALSILRADEVVEVFPLPPDVLDLPLPEGPALETSLASPEERPTVTLEAIAAALPEASFPALPSTGAGQPGEAVQPTTATLQAGLDGYSACSDTYIQFYLPTDNHCASPELYVVTSNKAATLLRFDLTAPPEGVVGLNAAAMVVEAKLELYAVQGNAGVVMGIYLPHGPWDPCAVTWDTPWEKPGADGISDREHEPQVEGITEGAPGWTVFDVTQLVQYWLREPSQNYGVIIKSFDVSSPSHHIFLSSDHPSAENRPKLTIKYEPALPTPTATRSHTAAATAVPSPTPAAVLTPTLIAPLSPRVIEVHWRDEMDMGDSYLIRAIFRPATAQGLGGSTKLYVLGVLAQLTAPTFDVLQQSPPEQLLEQPEETLSWSWQVTPRVAGSQRISLDLIFNWRPATSSAPAARIDPGTWYQTKVIKVVKPFAYWAQVTLLRNILLGAGLLCLVGWQVLRRRTKDKSVDD